MSQEKISSVNYTQTYPTHVNGLQLSSSAISLYWTLANRMCSWIWDIHPSHKDISAHYSGPVTATASACASSSDYDRNHITEYYNLFSGWGSRLTSDVKLHNQNCRGQYLTCETKVQTNSTIPIYYYGDNANFNWSIHLLFSHFATESNGSGTHNISYLFKSLEQIHKFLEHFNPKFRCSMSEFKLYTWKSCSQ